MMNKTDIMFTFERVAKVRENLEQRTDAELTEIVNNAVGFFKNLLNCHYGFSKQKGQLRKMKKEFIQEIEIEKKRKLAYEILGRVLDLKRFVK